jgi:ribosomal protein S18 acetylase RimI-like enzyme
MDISICTKEDIPQLKALWQECFDDTEEYIEYYFSSVAKRNIIFAARDNGRIVSMVHLNPYDVFIRNNDENNDVSINSKENIATDGNIQKIYTENIYNLHYIVGVATAVTHRKKGIMTQLMREAMDYLKRKGEPVTYLMPANQAYYTSLGFEMLENSYMVPHEDILNNSSTNNTEIYIEKYSDNCKGSFEDFNRRLSLVYDVFAVRDWAYMQELDRQCKSLGGHAYVLYNEDKILACCGVIIENSRADIVQYIASEDYIENLAYITRYLQYKWNDHFELFVNIKNLLPEEINVDKGHGIMYNILNKNFSKVVNCDKMLMINEIV